MDKIALKFTEKQKKHIKAWIEERSDLTCPVCGKDNFGLVEEVYQALPARQLGFGTPMAIVACKTCGLALNFLVQIMGVPFGDEQEEKKEDEINVAG